MTSQTHKPYFNQVAMVQSQYQSKRKMATNTNSSSLLQNKSPLRERQNTNSINTPSRIQMNPGNKTSLSPLRSKRATDTITTVRATAISRRKLTQPFCKNHSTKLAKFSIQKDNQYFYFCQKCAIPLISHGIKLIKIYQDQNTSDHPRIKQIHQFLLLLENMDHTLIQIKQNINDTLNAGFLEFQNQINKIQEFYSQFYCIIDQHKRRVIEETKAQYQKAAQSTNTAKKTVESAIRDSSNMRQDILASMNSVILQVMEHQFRSVMNQYYGNLNGFKKICQSRKQEPIKIRKLSFKDGQTACQNLIQGFVVQWSDHQNRQQKDTLPIKTETLSFNSHSRSPREQQKSDRENPIECLQASEKGNSNKKQLGGLFCSFDE